MEYIGGVSCDGAYTHSVISKCLFLRSGLALVVAITKTPEDLVA